jgi:hypothetical protein
MEKLRELVSLLMSAPDSFLDASLKPKIRTWSDPPTPLQILEVLDFTIHGGLASGAIVAILQDVYYKRLEEEKTTHEEVVKLATWRNESDRR